MPADYKSRVNHKQKQSLPGYLWLLSGLAIGLFVAFIVYLDKQPETTQSFGTAVQQELEKLKNRKSEEQEVVTSRKKNQKQKQAKKEPKFNFYTILPELEVLIPESETRPPVSQQERSNKISQTNQPAGKQANKQYVLQVGSFQNLQDAEKLKANLAFLGLSAEIQHVTVNNQAWHRVRTGPYQNKKQLYQNQKLLNKNNINFISMELK
jgi:cell division protein FtsN